jgi:hypothetical protein
MRLYRVTKARLCFTSPRLGEVAPSLTLPRLRPRAARVRGKRSQQDSEHLSTEVSLPPAIDRSAAGSGEVDAGASSSANHAPEEVP